MIKGRIIGFIVIILISFMTIGYAYYDKLLNIEGNLVIEKVGLLEITNVTLLSSSKLESSSNPTFSLKDADFNLIFNGSSPYQAVYQIELTNNSDRTYIFSGINYSENITSSNGGDCELDIIVEGIENGEVINSGDIKVFNITMNLTTENNGRHEANISVNCGVTEDLSGNILASVTPIIGDTRNKLAEFNLEVISTYSYSRSFNLSLSNSNFILVDKDGNDLKTLTINANSNNSYVFYIKASDEAIFLYEEEKTILLLQSNNMETLNINTITLLVNVSEEDDLIIPTVGNAKIEIINTIGKFLAVWDRIDTGGSSIINYTVLLYDENNELIETVNTNSDLEYYEFSNIPEGSYYFIVYGTDAALNTGEDYVSSATINDGYATKSDVMNLKWIYSIDTSGLNNMTASGEETAVINTSYTITLTANRNFRLPSSITVTMDGVTLVSGVDYTYTRSNGILIINNVSGDITISGNANFNICLVEGTKVKLYDGSYKNIEDINYDDLLMVYSYELGKMVYEYPIWIEKSKKTDSYQLTTFSDGSILKTVGFHGIYSLDQNLFVSVDDNENFKVGTRVLKFDKDNNFQEVIVTKIEEVYEEVNYYHVVSTRYYNIIANDFLTTDGTVMLSNLYGFNENITWTNIRDKVMNEENNLYKYEEFSDIVPYYMYEGLRMKEAKYLNNIGLSIEIFKDYLINNQLNEEMLLKPIKNNNGNNMWMVTTSDDLDKLSNNKKEYLLEEGSIYILKEPNKKENFIGWYNMSDSKYYQAGDKIEVIHGMHFEAIFK